MFKNLIIQNYLDARDDQHQSSGVDRLGLQDASTRGNTWWDVSTHAEVDGSRFWNILFNIDLIQGAGNMSLKTDRILQKFIKQLNFFTIGE